MGYHLVSSSMVFSISLSPQYCPRYLCHLAMALLPVGLHFSSRLPMAHGTRSTWPIETCRPGAKSPKNVVSSVL